MRITKECLVIIAVAITGIVIGGWLMYLIDTSGKLNRYTDALDVSHKLVNNCYEAFYIVSTCSTKDGCDFAATVDSLTELNFERQILKLKLDSLLEPLPTQLTINQNQIRALLNPQ